MYYLKYVQKLPLSLEASWDFFSSPLNLKIITPPHLGFEITNETVPSKMYAGQIITYLIRPLFNIPLKWVTEITHVEELVYFVDEQRFGPYSFWHHEHRFQPLPNGVEISDILYYKIPFGLLGRGLHHFKIRKDIEAIFSYRHSKLEEMFGNYKEG